MAFNFEKNTRVSWQRCKIILIIYYWGRHSRIGFVVWILLFIDVNQPPRPTFVSWVPRSATFSTRRICRFYSPSYTEAVEARALKQFFGILEYYSHAQGFWTAQMDGPISPTCSTLASHYLINSRLNIWIIFGSKIRLYG